MCPPEHNFDAHWPLAIFGTSVNIPCPRDAKGRAISVLSN